MIKIIGIKVVDRIKETGFTQNVLTKYSGMITTRLGFHELNDGVCSREGYILLHMKGDPADWEEMESELSSIGGIEVLEMDFRDKAPDAVQSGNAAQGGTRIIGVLVKKGDTDIAMLQKTLTMYGCSIRTRLGVNESHFGESAGLILLELFGDVSEMDRLEADLRGCGNCIVRRMTFGR